MSKLQVNDIVNKDDDGSVGFSRGAVVTGIATATGVNVTGVVTATTFLGDVTGDVTGTVTGDATGLSGTPNIDCGTGSFTGDVDIADKIVHTGDTNTAIRFPAADTFTVETAGSEAIRVDSTGRLLVGTSSDVSPASFNNRIQVNTNSYTASILLRRDSDNDGAGNVVFAKSRSGSLGGHTIVQSGDDLGKITYYGADGTDTDTPAASIEVAVDGTPGTNDMPGRLMFKTTADGASSSTERMRIHSGGVVSFNNGIELGSGLDATAANTLDDYEEGTWTPSIGGNATYTTQAGNYIKVGTMVLAHFRLTINAKGTGSTIGAISGLPFASTKASQNTSNLTWGSLGTNIIYGVYYVGSGSQTLYFSYSSSAAGTLTNNPDIFQNNASINGTIMYIA